MRFCETNPRVPSRWSHVVRAVFLVMSGALLACSNSEDPFPFQPRQTSGLESSPRPSLSGEGHWNLVDGLRGDGSITGPATLLPDGRVFFPSARPTAVAYNPGSWATEEIPAPRVNRTPDTAILMRDGRVLVAAGQSTAVEVYDPTAGTWTTTSPLSRARLSPTLTLLQDGRILMVGGWDATAGSSLALAEIYTPTTGTWTATGSLASARSGHTATLLPDGRVLVVGGTASPSAELYTPATATWRPTAAPLAAHYGHTATLMPDGWVLVAGGGSAQAEEYDPATAQWISAPSMGQIRSGHTATLMPDGRVLVTGGGTNHGELYSPVTRVWTPTTAYQQPSRSGNTATLLRDGTVLIAGGLTGSQWAYGEIFSLPRGHWALTAAPPQRITSGATAVLGDGRVLLLEHASNAAFVYSPASGTWSPTGAPAIAGGGSFTLLADGRLLKIGASSLPNSGTTEIYDPSAGTWQTTGSLHTARSGHTATLLRDGRVLVAGGQGTNQGGLASAELYDPSTGTWSPTGSLTTPRIRHHATLLSDGRVLVGGGQSNGAYNYLTEAYSPSTGEWSPVGDRTDSTTYGPVTLLQGGSALRFPDRYGGFQVFSAETNTWDTRGPGLPERSWRQPFPLPGGNILVRGWTGTDEETWVLSFVNITETGRGRVQLRAPWAPLPNGQILAVGQLDTTSAPAAEVYVDDTQNDAWRPVVQQITPSPAQPGGTLTITGSGFLGFSDASDGSAHASPSNFPLLSLKDIERGTWVPLRATSVSRTSLTVPLPQVPAGHYLLTLTVNALSTQVPLRLTDTTAPDTSITFAPSDPSSTASATFAFTSNEPNVSFACALDTAAFTPCLSLTTYPALAEGRHTFRVRARDSAGNADASPASHTWLVNASPPDTTIDSAPSNPSNSPNASFQFSANEAGSTFECAWDATSFSPCSSPAVRAVTEGGHTFQVRARDLAGSLDPSPAARFWQVDLTAPETHLLEKPADPSSTQSARFAFTSDDPRATFECSLDAAAFARCTSPFNLSALAEGGHTFQVRARDVAGNIDSTPASHIWQIRGMRDGGIDGGDPSGGASDAGASDAGASDAGPGEGTSDAGTGEGTSDAGSGGTPADAGTTEGSADAGSGGGSDDGPGGGTDEPPPSSGGCGCTASPTTTLQVMWGLLVLVVLSARRRGQ